MAFPKNIGVFCCILVWSLSFLATWHTLGTCAVLAEWWQGIVLVKGKDAHSNKERQLGLMVGVQSTLLDHGITWLR